MWYDGGLRSRTDFYCNQRSFNYHMGAGKRVSFRVLGLKVSNVSLTVYGA